jgi:hypothetical protein
MTANVLGRFNQSGGVANFASGLLTTGSATAVAVQIVLGFVPRMVIVSNETDILEWRKYDGMVAANTYLDTGSTGATTVDTSSAIVFDVDPGLATLAESFTMSAAVAAASKVIHWAAWG